MSVRRPLVLVNGSPQELPTTDFIEGGNAPSISPSLLLDFANSKTLDSRITFTRASTATRVNERGLVETVSANQPRFDHDHITGECKGLLIEEQRTNLLTYSEQFDNAAWTKSNVTVSANATTAPDGTLTADKLVVTTSSSTAHQLYRESSYPATNTTLTFSVYIKPSGVDSVNLQISNFANHSASVTINLTSKIVTTNTVGTTDYSNVSGGIYDVGDGWFKCIITAAKGSASSNNLCVINLGNGINDGISGIYIWGAQLEVGSFATSYIPTVASQVTRNADLASITGTNFSSWYRQDEGSFFAKADSQNQLNNAMGVVQVSDGTTNNRIGLYKKYDSNSDLELGVLTSGVGQAFILQSATPTATNLNSFSYKSNDIAFSTNGASVSTDTLASIPTTSQMNIGAGYGLGYLNGHISKLAYYPKRLSNAELQVLSQG